MQKYMSEIDGMVMAVIANSKLNLKGIINVIDYIFRQNVTVDEVNNSINNLVNGQLIIIKGNKAKLTKQGKKLVKGLVCLDTYDYYNGVKNRVRGKTYTEICHNKLYFSQEEMQKVELIIQNENEQILANIRKAEQNINLKNSKNAKCGLTRKMKGTRVLLVGLTFLCLMSLIVSVLLCVFLPQTVGVKLAILAIGIILHLVLGGLVLHLLDFGYPLGLNEIPIFDKTILILLYPVSLVLKILEVF